jgi:hypothetical protein
MIGSTDSTDFPVTKGAYQSTCDRRGTAGVCNGDVFAAKVNPAGALVYSTYLGGNGSDSGQAVAVDAERNLDALGHAAIVGFTTSTDFPVVNATQPVYAGGYTDAFVVLFDATGSTPVFSRCFSLEIFREVMDLGPNRIVGGIILE